MLIMHIVVFDRLFDDFFCFVWSIPTIESNNMMIHVFIMKHKIFDILFFSSREIINSIYMVIVLVIRYSDNFVIIFSSIHHFESTDNSSWNDCAWMESGTRKNDCIERITISFIECLRNITIIKIVVKRRGENSIDFDTSEFVRIFIFYK